MSVQNRPTTYYPVEEPRGRRTRPECEHGTWCTRITCHTGRSAYWATLAMTVWSVGVAALGLWTGAIHW